MTKEREAKWEKVIARCESKLAVNPNDVDALFEVSHALYQLGRFDSAQIKLATLAELLPDDHETLHALGRVLSRINKHQESVAHLSRAVKIWPKEPLYYADLGDSLAALGRISDARQAFELGLHLALPHEEIAERLTRSLDALG